MELNFTIELGDTEICLSVLVTSNYHDIPVYSANYSCIVHRLICTNLKECCHSHLTNSYKVEWYIFKCENRFEVLPPLSCSYTDNAVTSRAFKHPSLLFLVL